MDSNFANLKKYKQILIEFAKKKSTWRFWIWVLAVIIVVIFVSTLSFIY